MSSVTVRLMGGLGNQLFQYATARAISLRADAKLLLDIGGYSSDGLRNFELDAFSIQANLISDSRFKKSRVRRLWERILPLSSAVRVYKEPHFHFDESILELRAPIIIEGYWQSERYFRDFTSEIRNELIPVQPLEKYNAEIAAHIVDTHAVSLHIRRGDYITNAHTNSYHGVCPIEYYNAAIDFVRKSVGSDVHLFVFSDDHDWTKKNIKSSFPITYIESNLGSRGFRDMQLMSLCRHHIIANSSFSWWGAWLNPRPDKIVVAPKNWFSNTQNNTSDLMPESWVRL